MKNKMECDLCKEEKEGKFYQRVQTDNKIVCHDCYWDNIFKEVQKELDKDVPLAKNAPVETLLDGIVNGAKLKKITKDIESIETEPTKEEQIKKEIDKDYD